MSVLLLSQRHFFSEGIQKLLERWNKCIAKHGDYVEIWYNCKVSAVAEINYKNCVRILFDSPSYKWTKSFLPPVLNVGSVLNLPQTFGSRSVVKTQHSEAWLPMFWRCTLPPSALQMKAVWVSKMLILVYETAWSDILPSQNSMHINCFPVSRVMLLPISVHNSTILGSYSGVLTSWRE